MNSEEDEFKRIEAETKRRTVKEENKIQEYKKLWVGLTPEEILNLFDANNVYGSKWIEFARGVETKLKEKNNG